jgi:hypothetical protein
MIFQTFDDKKKCVAICVKGEIHKNKIPTSLTKTWDYSEALRDKDIKYAKYYCDGKSLDEACPDHLRNEWESVNRSLKAFYRAVNEAKLDLNEHCFFDLVPPYFLLNYAHIKDKICAYIFSNFKKPQNYEFMINLAKVLTEIKNTKLNIDSTPLDARRYEFKVRRFLKKINTISPYIVYNVQGTKTGRLTSKSFPILTMDKEYRTILKPNNQWFLELDYNAAELRVMLALLGKKQPKEDLHEWNLKNVYKGVGTRETAKKRIFAWLYNPESKDQFSSREYNREELLAKYWDGKNIKTYFGREIEADKHHALNYIIQSTAADLFLRQMINIWELLKDKKSQIAFCLHDSLVIDLAEEDEEMVNTMKEEFANTELGKFKVNVFGGKNFGEMKRMNVR